MNILILTPIHPMQIAEMMDFLAPYQTEENDIFSVQSMALLGEQTFKKHYLPLNYTYAAEIRKNPKLCLRKEKGKRKHIIIYGNLDKNTDMKFDHILAYDGHHVNNDEVFDSYLDKSKEIFDTTFDNLKIKRINWYTLDEAHHQFPTLHHLGVMLDTLGVKKINVDSIQSQTTTSD